MDSALFQRHDLDDRHAIYIGRVPASVGFSKDEFEQCWALHPEAFHLITIHGRTVPTPRWQQAYGRDYAYTGQVNKALPAPPLLGRYLTWAQAAIDARLNGILVNWYDGARGHYIGRHRDSTANMVDGAPIVTVSAGEQRTFRLRPHGSSARYDVPVDDGTVIVMPYETNLAWTHEVPKSAKAIGRRISITLRAFR